MEKTVVVHDEESFVVHDEESFVVAHAMLQEMSHPSGPFARSVLTQTSFECALDAEPLLPHVNTSGKPRSLPRLISSASPGRSRRG